MEPSRAPQIFWYGTPPLLGNPEQFATARRVFEDAGYNYANLCERLKVEHLYKYRMAAPETLFAQPIENALDALIRVFAQGLYVEDAALERLLPPAGLAAMRELHLLLPYCARPATQYCPASVFPLENILAACDRFCTPEGKDIQPLADAIYPALFANTIDFVERLPRTPCEAMLDIGTGTGIAAIRSASVAHHVWATDVTERARHFAEFNCRLAGLENFTVLEGDLYQPVEGLTFDRITAHPPYVPGRKSRFIYREGGEDGEQIFRRIVEGLPIYLRNGGRFYGLLMASDRKDETFEQRIRKWLGDRQNEFDVETVCDMVRATGDYVQRVLAVTEEEKNDWRQMWAATQTEFVLYGSVVIRRHTGERPPVTIRMKAASGVDGKLLDWLLDWETAVIGPGGLEMLLNSKPALSPNCELKTLHRVRNGRFEPEEFVLETRRPFETQGKSPQWMVETVAQCDGTKTWGERFAALQSSGRIPESARPEEFARMLSVLVASGVLTVERITKDDNAV